MRSIRRINGRICPAPEAIAIARAVQLPSSGAILYFFLLSGALLLAAEPPSFTSTLPAEAFVGMEYRGEVSVSDPEGETVSVHAVAAADDQANTGGTPTVIQAHTQGWQSFTAGRDGWLSSVRLRQGRNDVARVLRLREGEGTAGTLLFEQTFPAGGEVNAWREFAFSAGIAVVAGTRYTLEADAQGQSLSFYLDSSGDHYAGGRMGASAKYDYLFVTRLCSPAGLPTWLSLSASPGGALLSGTPPGSRADATENLLLAAADARLASFLSVAIAVKRIPAAERISRLDPTPTSAATVRFAVEFRQPVTGVDAGDFALAGGGSISSVTGAGSLWIISVKPSGDGSLRLDLVDDDSIVDESATPLGGPGMGNGSLRGDAYIVDRTPPTVSAPALGTLLNSAPGQVSVVFSEPVGGIQAEDFVLFRNGVQGGSASLSAVSVSGFVLDLGGLAAADGDYVLTLDAAGSGITDTAGNLLAAGFSLAWTLDATAPTAAFAPLPSLVNAAPTTTTLTFSEPVSGFAAADLVLTRNGAALAPASVAVEGNTVRIGLPAAALDGDYELALASAGLADAAGNALVAATPLRWTLDATAPTAAFAPLPSLVNTAPASATLTFTEPVSGFAAADLVLTRNGAALAPASVAVEGNTVRIGLPTAAQDGDYELALAASGLADAAGNALVAATPLRWTLDATAPTAAFAPLPSLVNAAPTTATLTFSEPVSGFDATALTLTRNGAALAPASVTVEGNTVRIGLPAAAQDGDYELALAAAGLADSAGNALVAATPLRWTLDATAPTAAFAPLPSLVNAAPTSTTLTFSEPVSGFDATALALTRNGANLAPASVAVEGNTVCIGLPAAALDGDYELALAAAGLADAAGNALVAATPLRWTLDTTAPTALFAPLPALTNSPFASADLAFSEPVTGLDAADLTLTRNGEPAGAVAVILLPETGARLAFAAELDGDYEIILTAAGSGIRDAAGNALPDGASLRWRVDTTAPTASFQSLPSTLNHPATAVTVAFSEPVENVEAAAFVLVRNGVAGSVAGVEHLSPSEVRVDLGSLTSADGEYVLRLADGHGIADPAGNALTEAGLLAWTMDGTAPRVLSIVRLDPDGSTGGTLRFEVRFSESVSGVDATDFHLQTSGGTTAQLGAVTAAADTATVEALSVSGAGTLELAVLDDDTILDSAGNPLGGEGSANGEFLDGELYTIAGASGPGGDPDDGTGDDDEAEDGDGGPGCGHDPKKWKLWFEKHLKTKKGKLWKLDLWLRLLLKHLGIETGGRRK